MSSGRFVVRQGENDNYHVLLYLDTVTGGGAVGARTFDLHMVDSLLSDCKVDASPIAAGDGKNEWEFAFADVDCELLKRWRLV